MKTAIALLMCCWGVALGQITGRTIPPQMDQKPLKCGPYQHYFHADAHKEQIPCNTGTNMSYCVGPEFDVREVNECVDDMHQVTERDWQELAGRVKRLELGESDNKADGKTHTLSGKDEDGHYVSCIIGKNGWAQCFGL